MISGQAAIILSISLLNFLVGIVCFNLFGKKYKLAWSLETDCPVKKDPRPYLVTFIGSLWTTYGMFLMVKHIRPQSIGELLAMAIGTWLFVVVGIGCKHCAYTQRSIRAFFIEYSFDLVSLILVSVLIYLSY